MACIVCSSHDLFGPFHPPLEIEKIVDAFLGPFFQKWKPSRRIPWRNFRGLVVVNVFDDKIERERERQRETARARDRVRARQSNCERERDGERVNVRVVMRARERARECESE